MSWPAALLIAAIVILSGAVAIRKIKGEGE